MDNPVFSRKLLVCRIQDIPPKHSAVIIQKIFCADGITVV